MKWKACALLLGGVLGAGGWAAAAPIHRAQARPRKALMGNARAITYLCNDMLFLYQGHVTEYLPAARISETTDSYARRLLESIIVFDDEEAAV